MLGAAPRAARALVEALGRCVDVAEQVQGRTFEEAGDGEPHAVAHGHRSRARGVAGGLRDALAPDRRADGQHRAEHLRRGGAGRGVQRPLRRQEPALRDVAVAARHARRREGEGEDGAGRDLLLVEAVEPALDRAGRALPGEGRHGAPQQARRPVRVAGRDRVVQRLGQLALLLVPGARPPVDLELRRGVAAAQPTAQRAADERVHAELLLGAVQRRERQARPRQAAQCPPGPTTVEDGVAEPAGEPLQMCGACSSERSSGARRQRTVSST